jgi:hypothetical protein
MGTRSAQPVESELERLATEGAASEVPAVPAAGTESAPPVVVPQPEPPATAPVPAPPPAH